MDREYISVDAGAALVGLSAWTLRQYLSQGKLSRFKAGRRTLLDKAEVMALVKLETAEEAAARNVEREQRRAQKDTKASPHPVRTPRKPRQQRVPSHT